MQTLWRKINPFLPVAIFGLAIAVCIISISFPYGDYDEGVYLATVKSVTHGFPLISQTYNSQGPLFIYISELFYKVWPSIVGVRLFPIICSLAVIYLAFNLINKHIGRPAAIFAALYLAVDTAFLSVSRTFQVDMPWLAFSFASFYFLLRFNRTKTAIDVWISAIFLAASLMLKLNPMFLSVILAYFLIVCMSRGAKYAKFLGCYVIAVLALLLILVPTGEMSAFYTNAVGVRTSHISVELSAWLTGSRWQLLTHELWLILGALGSIVLFIWKIFLVCHSQPDPATAGIRIGNPVISGSPMSDAVRLEDDRKERIWKYLEKHLFITLAIVWFVATIIGFSVYDPLFPHHFVFLILPGALVASFLVQKAFDFARGWSRLGYVVLLLAIVIYSSIQGTSILNIVNPKPNNYDQSIARAADYIAKNTDKNDYIITDEQLVLYLADRNTPPELVDTSYVRIQSGLLTDSEMILLTKKYNPKIIAFISGRFATLPGYTKYLEKNYTETEQASGVMIFTKK